MLPVSVVWSSSDMFMIGHIAYHREGVFFPLKIIYRPGKGDGSAQLGRSMLPMLTLVKSVLWHTLVPSVHLQTLLSWRRTVSPHQTSKRGSELFDFPDLIQGRREIASSLRRWSCRLRVDLRHMYIKTTSQRSLLTVLLSFSARGVTKPRIMNSLNIAATTTTFWQHHHCSSCRQNIAQTEMVLHLSIYAALFKVPSVLWHCWLGIRNSIWPVLNWVMRCWRRYLSGARYKWFAHGPADATHYAWICR